MTVKQARENIKCLVELARDHKIEYNEFSLLMAPLLKTLEDNNIFIKDVTQSGKTLIVVYTNKRSL